MSVDSSDKWRYTLYTTAILIVLFNPYTYMFMNSVFSRFTGPISNSVGCPTMRGFFIHALVFTVIIRYMMDIKI
jgi:threonine/homoserine/homoserine lactone efflux protein